jgi:hypothetical protein
MKKKTLKQRIHKYIAKKQDICCEEDIDRKAVVQQIVDTYKKLSKSMGEPEEEHINYMNNDVGKFIGYKVSLKNAKDAEGVHLHNALDKKSMRNMDSLLEKDVPLYFLLAFLGYASYRLQPMIED